MIINKSKNYKMMELYIPSGKEYTPTCVVLSLLLFQILIKQNLKKNINYIKGKMILSRSQ